MKDLIILTADKDAEQCLLGLLPRLPRTIEVREFSYAIEVHYYHDAGCRTDSHCFLRQYLSQYRHCMVVLDWEGAGMENGRVEELEAEMIHNLSINGWQDRCSVVVVQPELENWMWVRNLNVAKSLGWNNEEELYAELENQGFKLGKTGKPVRPKEAFEKALMIKRKPRSSSIYREIASTVSFSNCVDPSFLKFKKTLLDWFPKE